ncbi:hypothetical protein R3P38DRAFT_3190456 [Favolaschia claudopus]|uniref:Uncharacterized protein n=1 Tax=Favolaschia claudopus TaxID=2862362 RepID=A0AAW0BLY9_9AGAR
MSDEITNPSTSAHADGLPPSADNPLPGGDAVDGREEQTAPPPNSIVSKTGEIYVPPTRPAAVPRQKSKYVRRKKGEALKKPGKPGWIWGTKLEFFSSRKDEWLAAVEKNTTGDFYRKMAKLYTWKYGFDLKDEHDFECDVEDPPDWLADHVANEKLSAAETTRRQDCHEKIRERLGGWYRGQYTNLLKEDKETFTELFAPLGNVAGNAPRKPQVQHFYSTTQYEARIKPLVEERLKTLQRRAELAGEKPPHAVKVQNEVTKECWERESEQFQEDTLQALERHHQAAVKAWNDARADGPSRTAEQYSASLKTAAHYLQPFVDSIAERYGMCVSLLMAGPIGDRNGHIEMRSVHAGKTRGLAANDWPRHDPQGFSALESSMVDFAHHVFTDAECEARRTEAEAGPVRRRNLTTAQRTGLDPTSSPPTTAPNAGSNAPPASSGGETVTPDRVEPPLPPPPASNPAEQGNAGLANGPPDNPEENQDSDPDDDDERDGDGGEGANAGGEDGVAGAERGEALAIARLWKRKDRGRWSEELGRAFCAFERVKEYGGMEWAVCVARYLDFEKKCGYSEGALITTESRPEIVKRWIGRARKWEIQQNLGVLGAEGIENSFIDNWWGWWTAIQPKERGLYCGLLDWIGAR